MERAGHRGLLLVPALTILVGRANWWLPAWLDRLLPQLSVEGAEYFAAQDALSAQRAAEQAAIDAAG